MSVSRLSRQSIQSGFPKQQSIWDGLTQPSAMDALSAITLGSSQNSINFNNIPQTYTHLQLRGIVQISSGAAQITSNFNNDFSSSYFWHELVGDGGSTSAGYSADTSMRTVYCNSSSNVYSVFIIDILDYSNVNKNTTLRTLTGIDTNGGGQVKLLSGLWNNTAAVTSFTMAGATFIQYSSFSLYGIK